MKSEPASERLTSAFIFAVQAHSSQVRHYTGDFYIIHPLELQILMRDLGEDEDTQITALLHDTVEDCGISVDTIDVLFGSSVSRMVSDLSDMEEGNRATRKRLARERLSKACSKTQTVKVGDCLLNLESIRAHDPKFFKVFCAEIVLLLQVLTKANRELVCMLWDAIPEEYKRNVDWTQALRS